MDFKKRHANNAKAQMADDNSDEDDALFTLKDEQADSDKDAIIAYLKALIKNVIMCYYIEFHLNLSIHKIDNTFVDLKNF